MTFKLAGDGVKVARFRYFSVGAQLGPTPGDPAADTHPIHLVDITFNQPQKSVPDGQHGVAPVDAKPDGGPDGGVHAGGRSAAVEHCQPALLLTRLWWMWMRAEQGAEDAERVGKAATSHGHGRLIVLGSDHFRHLLGFGHTFHQR